MTDGARAAQLLDDLAARVDSRRPTTIVGWKALADAMLTNEFCAFHRNIEISYRYATAYEAMPAYFKWAGMAAFASHHIRLALYPLRLDADCSGYVDIPRSQGRRRLLARDIHTIRLTNTAIFEDIFWVHLAYLTSKGGIDLLRALLRGEQRYAPVLAGFEDIDQGRATLEASGSSDAELHAARDLIWRGNIRLLEHEQRTVVQPSFDGLSSVFAKLASVGALTNFEVRGMRQDIAYFTSFYGYSVTRGFPRVVRSRLWPSVTRFDDRWPWLTMSIIPRFMRLEADPALITASLGRILTDAETYAQNPCVVQTLHARDEQFTHDDALVDEMSEASFPVSDAPSTWAGRDRRPGIA